MPCIKCGDKWKLGKNGKCMYPSEAACKRAYKGYLFDKYGKGGNKKNEGKD